LIKFHHRLVRKIIRTKMRVSLFLSKIKYASVGQIKMARTTKIDPLASLDISPETSARYVIEIDENTHIKAYARLGARGGFIRIGKRCSINPFCMIYGYGGVTIGDDVRIAAHTSIIAFNHKYDGVGSISSQGNFKKGIVIEDNVWIGAGVRILDGVTIGKRCVVGAGSVVTRSVKSGSVIAGNPARIISSF
jgi:acetyltransferase-like isoleucine patch superfamily enzyme